MFAANYAATGKAQALIYCHNLRVLFRGFVNSVSIARSSGSRSASFLSRDFVPSGTANGRGRSGKVLALDPLLSVLVLLLIAFGLVMVYSATGVAVGERYGDPLIFVRKQGIAVLIGFVLFAICYFTPLQALRRFAPYALALAIFCALLPIIPGIGIKVGGAHRWAGIGPVRLQTGEFAKLFSIIFLAGYFARNEARVRLFVPGLVIPFLMLTPVFIGLLAQPDFGSCAVIALVTVTIGCGAGIRLRYLFLGGVALAVIAAMLIWFEPYRARRIVSFLSPMEDAAGHGYQLIQSLIAVGSGELTGVGLGSSQQKLFFLPAAHTDFIFALICEELGFLGALGLLGAFALFFLRGFRIANQLAGSTFEFCLALGITSLVIIPALLNVGVVIGLLPTKGLVLPLVGYGGSAVMMYLAALGFLFQLARLRLGRG